MYQIFLKNWDKWKYLVLSSFLVALALLLAVVYKSDQRVTEKSNMVDITYDNSDISVTASLPVNNSSFKKSGIY